MEFIMGMFMSIVVLITVVGIIICKIEDKKTKTLIKNISKNYNIISKEQEFILNEIGIEISRKKIS